MTYREEWLQRGVDELRPIFADAGTEVPERVRVSVGWPGGRGKKRGVVGQCWMPESVADKTPAIFVSPVEADPAAVLETLTHELVHACGHGGHRGAFARLAKAVGLVAPWKHAPAGPEMKDRLYAIAERLGEYDHSRIATDSMAVRDGTRMLKVVCPDCGYTLRTTRKWLDVGIPVCCCGTVMITSR